MIASLKKFYEKEGRHTLPWRQPPPKLRQGKPTLDPYKILVSELMLQQTQVHRVIPKYKEFLKTFPNVRVLAEAPLSQVLLHWQGLGYNRRAKFLHETAKMVVQDFGGTVPSDPAILETLPGIGPYTARAVAAFAYNQPVVFIETNIRTVYLLYGDVLKKRSSDLPSRSTKVKLAGQTIFFSKPPLRKISDTELLPYIAKDLQRSKMEPREFYWALMDYGAHLKHQGVKLNHHSKHYTKQGKFEGSARQLRGAIIKQLLALPSTAAQLQKISGRPLDEVTKILTQLQQEGLVSRQGLRFAVAR